MRTHTIVIAAATLTCAAVVAAIMAASLLGDRTPAPVQTMAATRPAEPVPTAEPDLGNEAVTSMWVWHNPIASEDDTRGKAYEPANAERLASFAETNGLHIVHLSAPWKSGQGSFADWLDQSTRALADEGIESSMLGGDPTWVDHPDFAVEWMKDATDARDVAQIQLDVEPWTTPAWERDKEATIVKWLAVLDAVKTELPPGVRLAIDAPWWLVNEAAPGGGNTLMDAVLDRVDRVEIVAFSDHAGGAEGIITLATSAVAAAAKANVPFGIGVETDSPSVAGGEQYTFSDDGPTVFETEINSVERAFVEVPGYQGITVQRYQTWRELHDL
ncbi:hypothetical protein WJX64_05225 [Leifsonia sp. YIM 134122]|uniref:GH26 domain-containing protein n=1 Tax=Leifsonia stereocauli TaxID=3134136 RepID=A0ABU9W2S2_9MICO